MIVGVLATPLLYVLFDFCVCVCVCVCLFYSYEDFVRFAIMKSRGLTDEEFSCNYVSQIWFTFSWMVFKYNLEVYIRSTKSLSWLVEEFKKFILTSEGVISESYLWLTDQICWYKETF